jgi:hypothetical protein
VGGVTWRRRSWPYITFAQARALAMNPGLTLRDLIELFQENVERPRDVFGRVWARPGCRMRVYRQSRMDEKGGGEGTLNQEGKV